MTGVRQLILQLLRTLERRVRRVEDQGESELRLLGEIKTLLIDLRRDHNTLRTDVLDLADKHGIKLNRHEVALFDKEKRLVDVEHATQEQSGEIAELEGRVLAVESRVTGGA